jgi:hypothetical protein
MTIQTHDPKWLARKAEWLGWVDELVAEIERWSGEHGWPTHRDNKQISEQVVGTYTVPTLRVRTPNGEIHIKPIALHVVGAEGRVDIEAWPTLNRVKLVRSGLQWVIITDSNVPFPHPWNKDTFIEIAGYLTEKS